jgi:maltose O-acetyltransferase
MFLYYGFASHLPEYPLPGGKLGRVLRQACAQTLLENSGGWINIGPRVYLGDGSKILLGDQSSIGRDSRVEALHVADGVMIGPELLVIARNHVFDDPTVPIGWQGTTSLAAPTIGYGSWLGARVTLLPGVHIGRYCVIGAGSVVTRDIADYSVAAGNPARVIRIWGPSSRQTNAQSDALADSQSSEDLQ